LDESKNEEEIKQKEENFSGHFTINRRNKKGITVYGNK